MEYESLFPYLMDIVSGGPTGLFVLVFSTLVAGVFGARWIFSTTSKLFGVLIAVWCLLMLGFVLYQISGMLGEYSLSRPHLVLWIRSIGPHHAAWLFAMVFSMLLWRYRTRRLPLLVAIAGISILAATLLIAKGSRHRLWEELLGHLVAPPLDSMLLHLENDAAYVGSDKTRINGASMVLVPAGPFLRGSIEDAQLGAIVGSYLGDENPETSIFLPAFYIDVYEVTIGQFAEFVADTGYTTEVERLNSGYRWTQDGWIGDEGLNWRQPLYPGDDGMERKNHPVSQVGINDAAAFCRWRGARLPTEAEWEKAARGIDGRRFPWGNRFDPSFANTCGSNCTQRLNYQQEVPGDDGYPYTSPVGSFPEGVSPYGVHDMAGNVWEWVQDRYDPLYFRYGSPIAPRGPTRGEYYVVKGGSFISGSQFVRTTSRSYDPTWKGWSGVGFRCALDV